MSRHSHSCSGDHDHEIDDNPEMGVQYSLYTKIDTENLECLNEKVEGSGKTVFKAWEDRLDYEKYVESDVDEELLFKIPFTGNVKLKGVIVIGGEQDMHPSRLRIYKNRPNMSFDDVSAEPDQEFELHPDQNGTLEYSIKVVKFSSVHHLTLHFPKNFGSETTKIYYIGLRGEYSEAHRHGVTICTYEARPNPADCKAELPETMSHEVH
ncbi:PITH domain-containing protein GA19395 [Schistocerca nitens]|uniref:PITH domain-containing protein GA19395 n=1 Tax=Schistocerca nitens TaxID=7011 RepID=UPI002117AC2B|nr:PITH domain-containing protein GA19395 [Schistocerca nitens]